MKYKVGDKVRIVDKENNGLGSSGHFIMLDGYLWNITDYRDYKSYNGITASIIKLESDTFELIDKNGKYITYACEKELSLIEPEKIGDYKLTTSGEQNKPKENKMSAITKVFKSKENKALEYFGLGSTCELNSQGLNEFLSYLYETDSEARKGFLAKMVEAYKEETKK